MILTFLYFAYCIIIFVVLFVDEKYFNIVINDEYVNYHNFHFLNETYNIFLNETLNA
jgi:hypothetical protein